MSPLPPPPFLSPPPPPPPPTHLFCAKVRLRASTLPLEVECEAIHVARCEEPRLGAAHEPLVAREAVDRVREEPLQRLNHRRSDVWEGARGNRVAVVVVVGVDDGE